MPKSPEREAFRKNWAKIISTVANQASVQDFANLLIEKNFSSQQTVSSILSVRAYSDSETVTHLMRAVETRVVNAISPNKVSERYKKFVSLVHDDLELTDLAQEMVETCRKLYENEGLKYYSPLHPKEPVSMPSGLRERSIGTLKVVQGEVEGRNVPQPLQAQARNRFASTCGVCAGFLIIGFLIGFLFYNSKYFGEGSYSDERNDSESKWSISPDDLTSLLTELKDIGDWKSLCTYLNVKRSIMEELEHNPSHNSKQKCLSAYLDSGDGNWKEVVQVICRDPFNKIFIGKQIAKKYYVPITECDGKN